MDSLSRLIATLPPPSAPPVHHPGPSAAVAGRLIDEGLISLVEASALLPASRGGRRVSTSALVRWIREGKQGVRLEAVRAGGPGWWTSKPAVARFLSALSVRA